MTEYLLPPTDRDIGQLSCVHIFMQATVEVSFIFILIVFKS